MTDTLPSAEALPTSLLEYDQWVCWRSEDRDGTPTKVPLDPSTGRFASSTNPQTWASFDDARAYAATGNADGVGFVFTEDDPFVGIDLDHCRGVETRTVHDWARAIVDQLDSYTEVSPSGTGVHVLVRGSLPGDSNRSGDVELYETARFFTVTGDHVDGTSKQINERRDALTAVHREHVGGSVSEDTAEPPAAKRSAGASLDDTTLIERAQQAANGQKFSGLWSGSTAGYESQSEADMALSSMLAFWTGGDAAQMDRLFRNSGLYRGKWDDVHFADGSTYGEKTIERAIAGANEFYTPKESPLANTEDEVIEDRQAKLITELQQEVAELTERLADRRETIEALETEVRSLEATNAALQDELEGERAATVEDAESTDTSPSLWERLRR